MPHATVALEEVERLADAIINDPNDGIGTLSALERAIAHHANGNTDA